MARLAIGVDVRGQDDVEKLAVSLANAETALMHWQRTSSKSGNTQLLQAVSILDSGMKRLSLTAEASKKSIEAFFSGQHSKGVATAFAQAQAVNGMQVAYEKYVGTLTKEILMESKSVQSLNARTAAIETNIAAYKKLGIASTYDKGVDYTKQIQALASEDAMIEHHIAMLKAQETEERRVQKTRNSSIAEQMERRYASEDAMIEHHIAMLKAAEAAERSYAFVQNASIAKSMERNLTGRDALRQGSYAVSDYSQQGRDRLAAGSKAGGYDYAKQIAAEASLFEEASGKVKVHTGILGKLGDAWDNAGKKASIFHNILRGGSGAAGALWMTYGQMLPMIVGFATVASTLKTVKLGSEFDAVARNIEVLNRDLGPAALGFDDIKKSILGIKNSQFNPMELAEGFREFVRAGLSVGDANKYIAETSIFARDAEMELAKATEFVVGQASVFEGTNIGQIENIITRSANDTTTSVKQMAEALKYASSIGKTMKIPFIEVSAALAVMAQNGQRGSMAGSQLATAMQKMVDPSSKARKLMAEVGVQFTAIDNKAGEVKKPFQLFSDLEVATKKLTSAQKTVLFDELGGQRGGRGISVLVGEIEKGAGLWKQELKGLQDEFEKSGTSASTLGKLVTAMSESGSYQLKMLQADVDRLFIESYDNASSVKMLKELRDVVNSEEMKNSLQFIVDKLIWISTIAAKGINIVVSLTEGDGTFSEMGKKLGAAGGTIIGSRAGVGGAAKGFAGGGIVGAAAGGWIDKLLSGGADKPVSEIDKVEKKIKEMQDVLVKAQTNAQDSTFRKGYWNEVADNATKIIESKKSELERLNKASSAGAVTNSELKSTKGNTDLASVTERLSNREQLIAEQIRKAGLNNYKKTYEELVTPKIKEFMELKEEEYRLLEKTSGKQGSLFVPGTGAYDKVRAEETKRIEQMYGKELEAAKKKDLSYSSDQIVDNRKAAADRRAEAEANKEANRAMRQLLASYDLYIEKMKDAKDSAKDWNKDAKTLIGDVDSFVKANATVGMTKIDAEVYKHNEAMVEAGRVQVEYDKILGQSASKLGQLGAVYGQSMQEMQDIRSKLATNSLGLTDDQVSDKTKSIINEQQDLVKEYDLVKKSQDELINKSDKLKEVTERLQATISNTSPWDAMGKAISDLSYTTEEKFNDVYKATQRVFSSMEDALVSFVTTGKLSFSDLANSIMADIAKIAVKQAVISPLMGLLGAGTSSASGSWVNPDTGFQFGGFLDTVSSWFSFHTGGVVGSDYNSLGRPINPSVFQGAPRFHSGLMPNEFPAILQQGEGVFTKAQMAALGASSSRAAGKADVGSQAVFNISITGDISKQTKAEIYKMLPTIATGVNAHNKEKGIK